MMGNIGRTKKRRHEKDYIGAVAMLIVLAAISILPLLLVIMNSFKTHIEIARNPLTLPTSLNINNYIYTWKAGNFGHAFMNSIKVTGTATIIGVIGSTTMGYVLATRRIRTWKLLTMYFMLASTVPLQMFMLPLYKTYVDMGLLGNQYAVGVAVAAWNLPMPTFIMRTYFLKVPSELEEAARIDGASTFQVFTRLMMPIASPGVITVALLFGLSSWNEYLLSSTLLQGDENFTATLKYLTLNGMFSKDFAVIMSGAVILIVPMLVVFLLLQRKFIEGMSAGAVKS